MLKMKNYFYYLFKIFFNRRANNKIYGVLCLFILVSSKKMFFIIMRNYSDMNRFQVEYFFNQKVYVFLKIIFLKNTLRIKNSFWLFTIF